MNLGLLQQITGHVLVRVNASFFIVYRNLSGVQHKVTSTERDSHLEPNGSPIVVGLCEFEPSVKYENSEQVDQYLADVYPSCEILGIGQFPG